MQANLSKVAQRRICQRQRTRAKLPPDPSDYDHIKKEFRYTFDKQRFLLKNIQCNEGRIMLFTTIPNLTRLAKAEIYIMDGTFSSAPSGFRQIFTIHGSVGQDKNRKFLPFVHFLLPDKIEGTYKKALKLLKNIA